MSEYMSIEACKSSLFGVTNDLTAAYEALCTDPLEYLLSCLISNRKLKEDIESSNFNFIAPIRPYLRKLIDMSHILGTPLSPVGLTTFTSIELSDLYTSIRGGYPNIEEVGTYIKPQNFSSGVLSRTGLWLAQNQEAATYAYTEFTRQIAVEEKRGYYPSRGSMVRGVIQKIPKRVSPPTVKDRKGLVDTMAHEGFHGIHISLSNTFNREVVSDDVFILAEALAFRTSLILGTMSIQDITQLLTANYFGFLSLDKQGKVNKALSIIYETLDPAYQRQITWRGIVASNLDEFMEPTKEMLRFVDVISNYSTGHVLPWYEARLAA